MRVLLVSNYLLDCQQSMLRFSAMLQTGLRKAGGAVRVIQPEARLGRFGQHSAVGKWLGYADKFVLFPARLRAAAASADVVHVCDQSNALYTKCTKVFRREDGRGLLEPLCRSNKTGIEVMRRNCSRSAARWESPRIMIAGAL